MLKVLYVLLLFGLILNLNAILVQPFNFENWNFNQDVEDAYELSYEFLDGTLVKVNDSSRHLKADRILRRVIDLANYYESLLTIIKDDIFLKVEKEFLQTDSNYLDDDLFVETDNRFRDIIEVPMDNQLAKYRHRLLNFRNKKLIESPDYTKVFINLQIREIAFAENYVTRRLGIRLESPQGNVVNARHNGDRLNNTNARPGSNARPSGGVRPNTNARPNTNTRPGSNARPSGDIRPNTRPNTNARPGNSSRPYGSERSSNTNARPYSSDIRPSGGIRADINVRSSRGVGATSTHVRGIGTLCVF
ncbi:hypothetical protein [Candidatus Borreliella tachyglossi]|uniref:hypothetical protein n=1 Tax=Candidatus Borreliella tachyglossi TaxID=1964448 RepID=UPI0040421DEA